MTVFDRPYPIVTLRPSTTSATVVLVFHSYEDHSTVTSTDPLLWPEEFVPPKKTSVPPWPMKRKPFPKSQGRFGFSMAARLPCYRGKRPR